MEFDVPKPSSLPRDLASARVEIAVPSGGEAVVVIAGEITAVEMIAHGGFEGQRVGRHIEAVQFHRIYAELTCRHIDHDFQHVHGLACAAAILGIAHHVGQHAGDLGVPAGNAVYACQPAEPAGGAADIAVGGVIGADRHLGVGA